MIPKKMMIAMIGVRTDGLASGLAHSNLYCSPIKMLIFVPSRDSGVEQLKVK